MENAHSPDGAAFLYVLVEGVLSGDTGENIVFNVYMGSISFGVFQQNVRYHIVF